MPAFFVLTDRKRVRVVLLRRSTRSGPGLWSCRFWWKGKEHFQTTGHADFRRAQDAARQAVLSADATAPGARLTLKTAIADYLAARWPGQETGTTVEHRCRLGHWLAHAGDLDLTALDLDATSASIQRHLNERRKTVKPRTVHGEQRVLSRFCAWLLKNRRDAIPWRQNPAARELLDLPAVEQTIQPALPAQALRRFLRELRRTPAWPAALLVAGAGLRPIGTLRVTWGDVAWRDGGIRVTEKRRTRLVPLSTWSMKQLRRLKAAPDVPVLPMTRNTLFGWVAKARLRAGLGREGGLQALRRTFISTAMDRGVPAELVASVAGNSVRVIEKHYKDLRTLRSRRVADAVDMQGMLGKARPDRKTGAKTSARQRAVIA